MHSIRLKTIILSVVTVVVSMAAATTVAAISIANFAHKESEDELALLCETGKNNLNYYFESVEQSVKGVSDLIDSDLDELTETEYTTGFSEHIAYARNIFNSSAKNANGVLTYYYRVDPTVTKDTGEKGFWYTNLDGKGFVEHEVTDLSDDQFECVWFYTPKNTGKPLWLPPYVTDNLDVYVVSYNYPVYRNKTFVGVVGIEISYQTLGDQIDQIKALDSGFAYIIENENNSIIYHPTIDILAMKEEDRPQTPPEFIQEYKKGEHHIVYTYEGVTKHSYWLELSNDMSIVVAVPASEISNTWMSLVSRLILISAGIIVVFVIVSILYSWRMTKSLKDLTRAAEEINNGNYDVELNVHSNDEIGTLSKTVNVLMKHLGEYIGDLNALAYADSLTNVANKGAFTAASEVIQKQIDNPSEKTEFAIAIMDCDNLKDVNDAFGHDKGDIYIRNTAHLIGRVFQNSVVYRLGGDEFAVILQGQDYKNRDQLVRHFIEKANEICAFAKEPWEKIRVSVGLATYDPDIDATVHEVAIHADHLMYDNKRKRKKINDKNRF